MYCTINKVSWRLGMDERKTYIAYDKDGAIVGLCSNEIEPGLKAAAITKWIKRGCNVYLISTGEVKDKLAQQGFGNPSDTHITEIGQKETQSSFFTNGYSMDKDDLGGANEKK
ncbi:MAG: hypothetical protein WC341_17920 [Bacteroidales bacterium]|jgi:hypothetical protein